MYGISESYLMDFKVKLTEHEPHWPHEGTVTVAIGSSANQVALGMTWSELAALAADLSHAVKKHEASIQHEGVPGQMTLDA